MEFGKLKWQTNINGFYMNNPYQHVIINFEKLLNIIWMEKHMYLIIKNYDDMHGWKNNFFFNYWESYPKAKKLNWIFLNN